MVGTTSKKHKEKSNPSTETRQEHTLNLENDMTKDKWKTGLCTLTGM